MKFREITLESGTKLLLGKNAENNEKLVKQFQGKENLILHTVASGSPFCVIESPVKVSKRELNIGGAICAGYSQDWRNNKSDVMVHVFIGKDVYKRKDMKPGTVGVKKKKMIKIKKRQIEKWKK